MTLANLLTEDERTVVKECLRASVEGPFFDEWEFPTLFGLTRNETRDIFEEWPEQKTNSEELECAVINSLNNLTGYPHHMESIWSEYVSVSPKDVRRVLRKIIQSIR